MNQAGPSSHHGDVNSTRKQWLLAGAAAGGRVLLVESITQLVPDDAGTVMIAGSHGGCSSAAYALAHPMTLVVFNDARIRQTGIARRSRTLCLRHRAGREREPDVDGS